MACSPGSGGFIYAEDNSNTVERRHREEVVAVMARAVEAYEALVRSGASPDKARRAVQLARYVVLRKLNYKPLLVEAIVPSQRLVIRHVHPEHAVTHLDLEKLFRGEVALTTAKVGRLPEDQVAYHVVLTRRSAKCTCPDHVYRKDVACVHCLAALARAYMEAQREGVSVDLGEVEWIKAKPIIRPAKPRNEKTVKLL